MKGLNVISLFDGMRCGHMALDRAGVKVNKYYASEIDKYASSVSRYNYPDCIELGDVRNWREWNIDWNSIDLLIGGSPCQNFSFSGKQKGMSTKTVPEGFTEKGIIDGKEITISNSQRYKMLGNGWTVDVIAHIFKNIKPLN